MVMSSFKQLIVERSKVVECRQKRKRIQIQLNKPKQEDF